MNKILLIDIFCDLVKLGLASVALFLLVFKRYATLSFKFTHEIYVKIFLGLTCIVYPDKKFYTQQVYLSTVSLCPIPLKSKY